MGVALQYLVGAVVGYLLGMIPTGALVGRRFGIDMRKIGSGSTGATNVLRTLGTRWAAVVALVDLFKATVACLIVGLIFRDSPADVLVTTQVFTAAFAVIGHTYSPLLGFKGGRGILTGGGGLIILSPPAFLAALVLAIATIATTRYVSLGSIVGAVTAAVVVLWQAWSGAAPPIFFLYGTLVPAFVIITHKGNIQRLLTGTERKLSRGTAAR